MPHPLPPEIAKHLPNHLPAGYELFWVRCRVIECGSHLGDQFNWPRTELKVFDCDAMANGEIQTYDIRLSGELRKNRVEPNDAVSFLGHRRTDEKRIRPRYFINHNTGNYKVAYYDMVTEDGVSGAILGGADIVKKWLTVHVTQTLRQRLQSVLNATLIFVISSIALAIAIWLMATKPVNELFKELSRDNSYYQLMPLVLIMAAVWLVTVLYSGFKKIEFDFEPIYKWAMPLIHQHAVNHQNPEAGFSIQSRQSN